MAYNSKRMYSGRNISAALNSIKMALISSQEMLKELNFYQLGDRSPSRSAANSFPS